MSTTIKYSLGLDIGGSGIKYGWGDCQQGLQHFSTVHFDERSLSCLQDTVLQVLAATDRELGLDKLRAIGIGTPGTIDKRSGKIVGINPNLPFWVEHNPAELIPTALDIPVVSANDANLMALAENWLRGGKLSLVGITVGSGIGSGFVNRDGIFDGAHGLAMEFGHLIVVPGGEGCSCGRRGCVEAYASVDSVVREAGRRMTEQGLEPARDLRGFLAARLQHPFLDDVVRQGMDALSEGLAGLMVLLDPDLIVIGGGGMDAGLYDLAALRQNIAERLPLANRPNLRLEKALEGNRAGTLGAILAAEQRFAQVSE